MSSDTDTMRVDKWLWAARFFKTRALAVAALESGKVLVNDARAKPARNVAVGDSVGIRLGPYHFQVEVMGLAATRSGAPVAQKLYRETEASRAQREAVAAQLKAQPKPAFKGRPSKRDRREMDKAESGNKRSGVW